MRKAIYMTIALLLTFTSVMSQKDRKINHFKVVEVPDSIKLKLLSITYKEVEKITAKTGLYIYNLSNYKDYIFRNGVYSFKGMGPHYPRRIFINYNSKTYIFKSEGAFDSVGVLQEFIDCIKLLEITEKDRIKYLKIISNYLQDELGQTYGTEITPPK